jgi:hypothetical protein
LAIKELQHLEFLKSFYKNVTRDVEWVGAVVIVE